MAFQDLPKEVYPFVIELIDESTNEVVWFQPVTVPGVVQIPGKKETGVEKSVATRLTWSEGSMRMSSNGKYVEE